MRRAKAFAGAIITIVVSASAAEAGCPPLMQSGIIRPNNPDVLQHVTEGDLVNVERVYRFAYQAAGAACGWDKVDEATFVSSGVALLPSTHVPKQDFVAVGIPVPPLSAPRAQNERVACHGTSCDRERRVRQQPRREVRRKPTIIEQPGCQICDYPLMRLGGDVDRELARDPNYVLPNILLDSDLKVDIDVKTETVPPPE